MGSRLPEIGRRDSNVATLARAEREDNRKLEAYATWGATWGKLPACRLHSLATVAVVNAASYYEPNCDEPDCELRLRLR